METDQLHARLLEDARRYDPSEHNRSLLAPYRDVLLLWRAKFMSYEQIAAALTRHGLKVSPAGVGVFCRRAFTKAEILRERKRVEVGSGPREHLPAPSTVAQAGLGKPAPTAVGGAKRGPKIARDDY